MPKTIDPKKKAQALKFISEYNAEHGRGGQTVAAKKFGLTPQTLIRWTHAKDEGGSKPAHSSSPAKKKTAGKATKKPTQKATKQSAAKQQKAVRADALSKLESIEKYKAQIADLEQKIENEKQALLRMLG